jgi:hypothetical protein
MICDRAIVFLSARTWLVCRRLVKVHGNDAWPVIARFQRGSLFRLSSMIRFVTRPHKTS